MAKQSMDDYAKELESSFKPLKEGDIIEGSVIGVSETEVYVDLNYYTEGVIRAEDYSNDPSFSIKADVNIGDPVSATIIRMDDGQGNILLSKKEANEVLAWDKLKELMNEEIAVSVKIAEVVKGGVVTFLEGIRAFIPASKLDLNYVEQDELENWLHKTIQVRVITADESEQRLVLSAREILRERAELERKNKGSTLNVGFVTEGTVESLQPYGAFVNLGNGLSGLVHISQICERRIKHPKAELSVGQKVKVKVIDIKDGKLSLSMKALNDVTVKDIEEEVTEIPESEELTTNLGSLFANIKLN
ncbi:MAG: S1 RNA-binding domain-containing protein [Lachnospiraceae bacterium]|nr:S1 RNA-binding domain-containing protein [Lachnospiraceae bacterium]